MSYCPECANLIRENTELRQRAKDAEADARRYAWLRDMPSRAAEVGVGAIAGEGPCMLQRESLDAAIDAALSRDDQEAGNG